MRLDPRIALGLLVIYVIWGSTYLAIRLMVETVPALLGAGTRFLLAGAILLAALALRRRAINVTRTELWWCAVIGTLLCFGGNGLVTLAEEDVPSGLAALLIAAVPLFVVLMRAATRDRIPTATVIGVLTGFAGVALVALGGSDASDDRGAATAGGIVLIILAAFLWALGSFSSRRVKLPESPLVSTGWQMLIGGAVMLVASAIRGELGGFVPGDVTTESALAFAYLVTIGGLFAYSTYVWLLQNAPVSQVSTYAYVNPVIAVVLAALWLDEEITATTAIGAAIVIASVATVVRRESTPVEAPVEERREHHLRMRAADARRVADAFERCLEMRGVSRAEVE